MMRALVSLFVVLAFGCADGPGAPDDAAADVPEDVVLDVPVTVDDGGMDAAPDVPAVPPARCDDGLSNGSESDVDCGGRCEPCLLHEACLADRDCASGACASGECVLPTCMDGRRDGFESDVDCGGLDCARCALGQRCTAASHCVTDVCTAGLCVAPSCDDGLTNADETDEDCGGEDCDPCAHLETCAVDADCESGHCEMLTCVNGPVASLVLDVTSGEAPLRVRASGTVTLGDFPLASTQYDFGLGFGSATERVFQAAGSYLVRMRVTDTKGLSDVRMMGVEVAPSSFTGTYLSETDLATDILLGGDRLSLEVKSLDVRGVRSTRSVSPGEGVFYFEASIPETFGLMTVGVATAAASLGERAGENAQSFGLDTGGQLYFGGMYLAGFDSSNLTYGFVLDYREATPTVHVIMLAGGEPTVVRSQTLTGITEPLFLYAAGMRRTPGTQLRVNTGNDTENFPFTYDPVEVLTDASLDIADDVVLGFGGSRALPPQAAPTLSAPSGLSVAAGTPVMLTATAADAEDGSLTPFILWEDLATGYDVDRVTGTGGTFLFTPTALGIHPVRLTVVDSGGRTATTTIDVVATGALPSFTNVQITQDARSGAGITVSPEGYAVHYGIDAKNGIRVNQAIYGAFWYFEAERLVPVTDQGVGLVVGAGDLDPYRFNVTPPSCSLNVVGATWRNLIFHRGLVTTATHYGFAVDYRARYPIVYVIVDAVVIDEIHMRDATVPVHPMLYGNETHQAGPYDMALNLGQAPFHYDARAALTAYGVSDASELVLCWGADNAACP